MADAWLLSPDKLFMHGYFLVMQIFTYKNKINRGGRQNPPVSRETLTRKTIEKYSKKHEENKANQSVKQGGLQA